MKYNKLKWFTTIAILIVVCLVTFFYILKKDTSKQKEKDLVKIQLSWSEGSENAFLFYGIEKGIFDSLNIKIEYRPSKGSSIVATGLANNEFNFGFISSDYVVISKSKGLPIKALIALYHQTPVTIFSLKGKNIVSIQDLKEKKLGVIVKSSTYPQVISFLQFNKLESGKDFTEEPVSGTLVELLNNKVDAMMHYTNYGPAEMLGKQRKEINEIKLSENGVNMYGTCIVVNEIFAKENDEIVARFIKGCLISLESAKNDHQGALTALLKYSPNSDRNEFDLALKITEKMIYDSTSIIKGIGYMTTEGWQQTLKQVEMLNNEKFNISVEDLFTTKYLK